MLRKLLSFFIVAISIALMIPPWGVAMIFAPGPNDYTTSYYSYFSLMPLGNGNWFPILTALLSLAALILLLAGFWKHTKKPVVTCLSIAVSASVMSWLLFHSISSTSIAIALLHVAALLLELFPSQKKHSH